MKRVACYVRVSTEEQRNHGISVESQINDLKQYCKDNNYNIAGIYNDAGISARKSYKKRPALLQMINDCQQGKIDLILICKLDRFFRSVPDYYAVMEQIGDIPWKAIHEDYETETSAGVFKVNIMLSVAQSEADRTSERINKVFEYKKAKGEVCSGSVGWGYKIENKKWVKDKEVEPLVNEFFKTFLATFSRRATQKRMEELGLNMPFTTVDKLLNSPAYYGDLKYVTEAYITKEQHEQILKARQVHVRTRKREYLFSGVGKCGLCGGALIAHSTPRIAKDGTERNSICYYCSRHERYGYGCDGVSINQNVIEAQLLDNLEKALDEHNDKLKQFKIENGTHNTANQIANIKKRLSRLKDLYELGDIELEEYKQKRDALNDEINKLESIPEITEKTLPPNWKEVYQSLDIKHKNAFWLRAIDHFEVNERKAKSINIFF